MTRRVRAPSTRPATSFIDRGDETIHIARNDSLLNEVELWATYLVPGAPGATSG